MELFAPTPAGKLEGEQSSKEIGIEGGELSSADNAIRLVIPPGAVSKNTLISLQPATNLSQDGVGKSFHLEPSGIKFNVPVKLVLHYDPKALNGNPAQFLAIVFQDEKGSWFSIGKFEVDTIARTVTGNIKHFSDWALCWSFHLRPDKSRVKVSKTVFINTYPTPCSPDSYSDELRHDAVLGIFGEHLDNPRHWTVNSVPGGDANNGIVDESAIFFENGVEYKAPAVVPEKNPVEIKLVIEGVEILGKMVTFSQTCKIKVYDNYYEVKMLTTMKGGGKNAWGGHMTYRDEGSFLISVDQDPELLDIDNRPEQLNYETCTITVLNPATRTGMINVTGIKSWKITPANPPLIPYPMLEIAFVPNWAEYTRFKYNCAPPPGIIDYANGVMTPFPLMNKTPCMPMFIKFKLNDEEQVLQKFGNPGDEIYLRLTVKKKQD
jgi:hypothetical protein